MPHPFSSKTPTGQPDCSAPRPRARLLTRREAAAYCRLSPQTFSLWIAKGRLPTAIEGTSRWDIQAIDAALDQLSGVNSSSHPSALDLWKAKKNARTS